MMSGAKDGFAVSLERASTQRGAGATKKKEKVQSFPEDLIEKALNALLNFHFW